MKQLRLLAALGEHGSLLKPRKALQEIETTFGTPLFVRTNRGLPCFVALASIEVAQFFARRRMTRILPLTLASRSEPYELVTRKGAPLQPAAKLLIDELVHRRS